VVDLDVLELDNVSLTLLSALARNPDAVDELDGLGLLFDNAIADWVLQAAVDSGACDGLTTEMLDDLAAVGQLGAVETEALLSVAVEALALLDDGDGLRALLDLVVTLEALDALPQTLPCLTRGRTTDLDAVVRVLRDQGAPPSVLASGLEATLRDDRISILAPVAAAGCVDPTWTSTSRLQQARLSPESTLRDPGALLRALGELSMPSAAVHEPGLAVLTIPGVSSALLAAGNQETSPLAWADELIRSGAVSDLRRWIQTIID
jgi:hypothetical protein